MPNQDKTRGSKDAEDNNGDFTATLKDWWSLVFVILAVVTPIVIWSLKLQWLSAEELNMVAIGYAVMVACVIAAFVVALRAAKKARVAAKRARSTLISEYYPPGKCVVIHHCAPRALVRQKDGNIRCTVQLMVRNCSPSEVTISPADPKSDIALCVGGSRYKCEISPGGLFTLSGGKAAHITLTCHMPPGAAGETPDGFTRVYVAGGIVISRDDARETVDVIGSGGDGEPDNGDPVVVAQIAEVVT
jgi:hypothetical protein